MSKLSDKITAQIKKKKVLQKPKIIFLLKNISFWGLYIFAAIVGALAFSVILLAIFEIDFEAARKLIRSPLDFVRTALPFTWILLFSLLFALAFFGARHTKKGYRFSAFFLSGINIAISILLGLGLYVSGFAHAAERTIAKNIPVYKMLEERREQLWHHPENGLLTGEINQKWNGEYFIILDGREEKWKVFLTGDTKIPTPMKILLGIETGEIRAPKGDMNAKRIPKIKIIGEELSQNEFEAEIVLPWQRDRFLPERVRHHEDNFSPEQREKIKNERK